MDGNLFGSRKGLKGAGKMHTKYFEMVYARRIFTLIPQNFASGGPHVGCDSPRAPINGSISISSFPSDDVQSYIYTYRGGGQAVFLHKMYEYA